MLHNKLQTILYFCDYFDIYGSVFRRQTLRGCNRVKYLRNPFFLSKSKVFFTISSSAIENYIAVTLIVANQAYQ